YKDKGVTVIGYSAQDPSNTEQQVAAFVKKRGPKLGYTFAFGEDRKTWDAWMRAAGRKGIPCTFVVDRDGRIAYIGHPTYLGVVLPWVSGGANPQAISAEMGKIEKEVSSISAALARDPRAGLKALAEFEARYPSLANTLPWVRAKLSYLPKYGKPGEAKKF